MKKRRGDAVRGRRGDSHPVSDSPHLPLSHMRVLLWDLDGTLVRGRRLGAFKDYTVPMLEKVFGTAGTLPGLVVYGMTDLQIVEGDVRSEDIAREQNNSRPDELLTCQLG